MDQKHQCDLGHYPYDAYGSAVDNCYEDDNDELWVSNGEYTTRVNYCPKCGYKAQKLVEEI